MDKEKLFEKSRKENQFGDEKTIKDKVSADVWGMNFGYFGYLIVKIIYFLKEYDSSSADMVFICMILGNLLYMLKNNRNDLTKSDKIFYIIKALGLIVLFVGFLGAALKNG